jgi:ATP-dependent Clp protease ATP-binding subunit ClpA
MFERFTDRARSLVARAQAESHALRHHHIGTEHLLLAMLDRDGGTAYRVLTDAGVERSRVLADVKRFVRAGHDIFGDSDVAALQAIGIDLDAVRKKIEETFGPGALDPPPEPCRRRGLLRRWRPYLGTPFTPRAKKVLELSLREAVRLRHGFIGTEHILLGLLREGHGLAAKVLVDEGFDLEDLRRWTLAALDVAA